MAGLILSFSLQAQLCTGSLGDPVVNITFDNNSNFKTGNDLTFTSLSCPNDGFYTITRSSSACFNGTWHTVSSDHTGNGSFMLVNASYEPSDFFVTTIKDLCPETTYEFAAWLMNVQLPAGIFPNVTFTIETPDGTILQKFDTGEIWNYFIPIWKQYGFFFKTPAGNPVIVLRMRNNAPGGYGNDLALDDITFRPCGAAIQATIANNSTDTVNICTGDMSSYAFDASVSSGYQSPSYQWQSSIDSGATWADIPGATTLRYDRFPVIKPGSYWYRLAVSDARYSGITSCRISSNPVIINVHPEPTVSAGADRVVLTGDENTLDGQVEGEGVRSWWTPSDYLSDINVLSPITKPTADIIYTLHAVSSYGCENEDNVLVKVVTGIYVPSAFTPNNDGRNDTWQIPFLDPAFGATVSVFNRSGRLVYRVNSGTVSWNGALNGVPQASGVYVYLITFKHRKMMKGTVTLIR